MRLWIFVLAASMSLALLMGGCPGSTTPPVDNTPPNSGGNTGGGSGGGGNVDDGDDGGGDNDDDSGDGDNDGGSDDGGSNDNALSSQQIAAVDDVVLLVEKFQAAMHALHPMTQPQFDLDVDPGTNFPAPTGSCPSGNFISNSTTLAGDLLYGDSGCSSALTAGLLYQGPVRLEALRSSNTIDVSFEIQSGPISILSLTIAGNEVSGGFAGTLTNAPSGIQFVADADFAVAGFGSATGLFNTQILDGGGLETDGDLTLITGSGTYQVVLQNVQSDPVNRSTFLPTIGALTFGLNGDDVDVDFSSATASAGTVEVSINGAAAISHTLP
jgi:hypothetical protein